MKKFFAVTLTLCLALCAVLGLAACKKKDNGPNYGSDTFTGAISEQSYNTAEDAVTGFLAQEISGEAAEAVLVSFDTKKELNDQQIAELNTDTLAATDTIVSAKEVEVRYRRAEQTAAYALNDGSDSDYFVFTVIIIEISPNGSSVHEFRYYVPKANQGDVLTRSYYADLLDPAKYTNCTQVYKQVTKASFMTVEITYTIKIDGNKLLMEMHLPDYTGTGSDYLDLLTYMEYDAEQEKLLGWVSTDGGATYTYGEATQGDLEIDDLDDFSEMCLPDLDYSYYEKTSYGFTINKDFLDKYLNMALQDAETGASASADMRFYVLDGKLAKVETTVEMMMDIGGGNYMKSTSTGTIEYKDFGTTKVEKPSNLEV